MNCDACKAEIAVGSRWCGVCHAFARNPDVGTLAPPIKRLAAYATDVLVPLVTFIVLLMLGGGAELAAEQGGTVSRIVAVIARIVAVIALFAYVGYAVSLFAKGQTPGKKLVGIQVITQSGEPADFFTMLVREWIGKWISGFVFGLGLLWILIDPERQAWHDKLMTTYVIEPTT